MVLKQRISLQKEPRLCRPMPLLVQLSFQGGQEDQDQGFQGFNARCRVVAQRSALSRFLEPL